ncbi:MAG TPA: glycosyltransferase [Ferruginibacter sp.]|nr:glycosyltransferase [Ferruginibacter sp.]
MKIAFIDNLPVGGGLSRFSLKLCESLIRYNPDVEVYYLIHADNVRQIPEIFHVDKRVSVHILKTTKQRSRPVMFLNNVFTKAFNVKLFSRNTIKEIEGLIDGQYDVAYFPSAHMMAMPDLKVPCVGTIHDFNWKYFFGAEIFTTAFTKFMDTEIQKWLSRALCISSAHDVVNEAKKNYPGLNNYPVVIPIPQVVVSNDITEKRADEILVELGIDYPYIIFPGHFFPHKNHLNLFTAFHLFKRDPSFDKYKLVLTGVGTDKIGKGITEYRGVRKITNTQEDFDVIGMGYQPNEFIDTLIMKASLLVSPSIYEAICTPGMDAWSFGVPTAISDIPPFREHEAVFKIKSAFFDPMNPHQIAETLTACFEDLDKMKKDAEISQVNMLNYTWEDVAKSYMDVFKKAINK